MEQTLLTTSELAAHLGEPDWAVVDCRFTLAEPERGRQDYLKGHIPGAVYAHLDEDLAAPAIRGVTGRHPLPEVDTISQTFSRWGIGPGVQVVAYDDAGGALAAVRVWWLLRWLGHTRVAVLDGGWQRWVSENRPVRSGVQARRPAVFTPQPRPGLVVSATEVEAFRQDPAHRVFDARIPARFRGEVEPYDPVAGRVPGAVNAPWTENLGPDGAFRPARELHAHYLALLDGLPAEQTAVYCGSGVNAMHNILAMVHAGLGEPRLYSGSWSEWITDPRRPVATG